MLGGVVVQQTHSSCQNREFGHGHMPIFNIIWHFLVKPGTTAQSWHKALMRAPALITRRIITLQMIFQVQKRHTSLLQRHARRRAAATQLASLRAWHDLTQLRRQRCMALLRLLTKNLLKRKREAFSRYLSLHTSCFACMQRCTAYMLLSHKASSVPEATFGR